MTDSQTIPDQIIARLYEDMASSPVDDVTIISRPQLEALQSAIENSAKAIHDAVMAERARCAGIVEAKAIDIYRNDDEGIDAYAIGQIIVAAIRGEGV